jgi:hypothetical protein
VNSYYHAQSCVRRWGGGVDDYLPIHEFLDSSKMAIGDIRHRSLYHHTLGVWLCQRIFGTTVTVQKKTRTVEVPVRLIAEQHILEDLGWLPSPNDYIDGMPKAPWMSGSILRDVPLSTLLKGLNNDPND